ncbi:MAG: SCO family protein [Planctomycetota bacterium]
MTGLTPGNFETQAQTETAAAAQASAAASAGKASASRGGGLRWPWLIGGLLCVAGAAAMVVIPFVLAQAPEPLERYGAVPSFALTDRFGEPFTNADVAGKVWVANFMFTTCPSICPVMSRHLGGLQAELRERGLRDGVAIVSFSVQPEVDTPEVLRDYGNQHGAEPGLWNLLTGDRADIWQLSKDGFKLHVGAVDNPVEPIAHTGKLVLVDQAGVIRGYYDGLTPAVIDVLAADMEQLVSERP